MGCVGPPSSVFRVRLSTCEDTSSSDSKSVLGGMGTLGAVGSAGRAKTTCKQEHNRELLQVFLLSEGGGRGGNVRSLGNNGGRPLDTDGGAGTERPSSH